MKSLEVSRRRMMALLGAGAAMVPALAHAAPGSRSGATNRAAALQNEPTALALLAPLAAGSQLASWRVEQISTVRYGAVTVGLRDAAGQVFFLDICGHDSGPLAPVAPGRSELYDVFVANLGDGSRPTDESHGLAAMAVAEVLRTNEHRVSVAGFLTLRDRLSRHADKVQRGL